MEWIEVDKESPVYEDQYVVWCGMESWEVAAWFDCMMQLFCLNTKMPPEIHKDFMQAIVNDYNASFVA